MTGILTGSEQDTSTRLGSSGKDASRRPQATLTTDLLFWPSSQGQSYRGIYTDLGLNSKRTKSLTDSEGLVPATGEYMTRYCCTGPGAGSQRTSRLFGVGLYTWTFLASPLTTGKREAHTYFLKSVYICRVFMITSLGLTLYNRIKHCPPSPSNYLQTKAN